MSVGEEATPSLFLARSLDHIDPVERSTGDEVVWS